MKKSRVAVIILNWNGWRDTIECLESLYRSTLKSYDVILVDNGSRDGSIEKILDYCAGKLRTESKFFRYSKENKPIHVFNGKDLKSLKTLYEKFDPDRRLILLALDKNFGYTGGNNIGAKLAKLLDVDYICVLNNDIVVEPNTLKNLVECIQTKEASIAGPLVFNYHTGEIASAGIKIDLFRGLAFHQRKPENKIDCVEGSCMLIDKSLLSSRGIFDDEFFAYWEETDLCMRAKMKGKEVVVCPHSKVWHKVTWHAEARPFNLYLLLINNIRFVRRYGSLSQKLTFLLYFIFRILPTFTARSFCRRPLKTIKLIIAVLFFLFFGRELLPKETFL